MVVHWARVCDTHTLGVGQICPAWSHKTHSAISGIKKLQHDKLYLKEYAKYGGSYTMISSYEIYEISLRPVS